MFPFNELCRALDRYNRRRQGMPEAAAEPEAHEADAAPLPPLEEAHAPAYGHDEESPQAAASEPAWNIAATRPRSNSNEEPTGELYLDEINEVDDDHAN